METNDKDLDVTKMNIFEKMQAISNDIGFIQKELNVATGKTSSYKAVSERDVIAETKKYEKQYRLYSLVSEVKLLNSERFTNSKGNIQFDDRVEVTMDIINLDNTSEIYKVKTLARGLDGGDKGFGKATTYGRKYALLNAYKLGTGEDPDNEKTPEQQEQEINDFKANVINILNNNEEYKNKLIVSFGISELEDMTDDQYKSAYLAIQKKGLE
ncbi:ERF family protein [Erysipelotrichaceae bacterium OttesenSCG-928-M19]|nr:ERF family protein [Erysipelotrichaceae bacterium OttesenSCG-928-M19]